MSKKILIIDNYDSFTYNLAHAFEAFGTEVEVVRNDVVTIQGVRSYDKIVLSPGPGLPSEAGKMSEIINAYAGQKSFLGICLGCQGLAEFYGASLFNVPEIIHGQPATLRWDLQGRLAAAAMRLPAEGGLYHSWAIDSDTIPNEIIPIAWDNRNILMACEHKSEPSWGIQFHPESRMTDHGRDLLQAWLKIS